MFATNRLPKGSMAKQSTIVHFYTPLHQSACQGSKISTEVVLRWSQVCPIGSCWAGYTCDDNHIRWMTHAYNIPDNLLKLHFAAELPKRAPVLDSSFLAAWDGIEAMRARQDLCWKAYAPPSTSRMILGVGE